MITPDYLKQLFPREGDIPSEYRQLDPVHQRTYLVDGELKTWKGNCQTVLSPVHVHQGNGALAPAMISPWPTMRCGSPEPSFRTR